MGSPQKRQLTTLFQERPQAKALTVIWWPTRRQRMVKAEELEGTPGKLEWLWVLVTVWE
jgi:hypothetical protein